MESRRGEFSNGDARSQYTAWFDAGDLRKVEENLSLGEYGASHIAYYFYRNTLFYYREEAQRTGAGRVGIGMGERTERVFAYDSVNQLSEARKFVNGVRTPVEDYELMAIRNHMGLVKDQVFSK